MYVRIHLQDGRLDVRLVCSSVYGENLEFCLPLFQYVFSRVTLDFIDWNEHIAFDDVYRSWLAASCNDIGTF